MPGLMIYFKGIDTPTRLAFKDVATRNSVHKAILSTMLEGDVWTNDESTIVTSEIRAIMNTAVAW